MLSEAQVGQVLTLAGGGARFRIDETGVERLATVDDVWKELEKLPAVVGWLCVSDELVTMRTPTVISRRAGTPLAGEWLCSDGSSLHLRHLGGFQWILRRLARSEDPVSIGTVREMFVQGEPQVRARYEVGWLPQQDPPGRTVLWPAAARFAGFVNAGESQ